MESKSGQEEQEQGSWLRTKHPVWGEGWLEADIEPRAVDSRLGSGRHEPLVTRRPRVAVEEASPCWKWGLSSAAPAAGDAASSFP